MSPTSTEPRDEAPASSNNNAADQGPRRDSTAFIAREMTKAFEDLARGEEAASLIEASLSAFETKLDAILAAYGVASPIDAAEEPEMDGLGKTGDRGKSAGCETAATDVEKKP